MPGQGENKDQDMWTVRSGRDNNERERDRMRGRGDRERGREGGGERVDK